MPDPFREITKTEARGLLAHWDVGEFVALPGERGGTANPAVVIDTDLGRYFLKRRNPRYCAPEALRHDHALMAHLAAQAFPCPLACVSRGGGRWIDIDGDVFELYPYMPGERHDPTRLAQIEAAGEALARFHCATAGFEPPAGKEWPRYNDPRGSCRALEWALSDLDLSSSQRDEISRLHEIATDLAHAFTDEAYHACDHVVVHGDWHPANVKYGGDVVCGVFDLDWATRQPRMIDIADGIIFFAGVRDSELDGADIWSLTQTFTLDEGRTRGFLRGYSRGGGGEVPEPDWKLLAAYMLARWLYCRTDPMRRKLTKSVAARYLLSGIWGPIFQIQRFSAGHGAVYDSLT